MFKNQFILLALSLLLTACVTINVYFPAAAAEKAADQIIENVMQSKEQKPSNAAAKILKPPLGTALQAGDKNVRNLEPSSTTESITDEPASSNEYDDFWGSDPQPTQEEPKSTPPINEGKAPSSSSSHWLVLLFDFFISKAYGAELDIDISSPAIQALQQDMVERYPKLEPGYNRGAIGMTNDGLIAWRDLELVPFRHRRKVKRWVEEENQTRLSLYSQIAIANYHPEWQPKIRQTFAKRWIEHAKEGWWYQDKDKQWQRKVIEDNQ